MPPESRGKRSVRWRVPMVIPGEFTRSPLKAFHFAQEPYFRDAWRDFAEALPAPHAAVQGITFVLFKPDGVVARVVEPALAKLEHEGFQPVSAVRFSLDRMTIRELWRYELNLATMSRLDTIDRLLTASPSLLVLLRDTHQGGCAAERLARFKGPSQCALRKPHELRTRIGAKDGLFNFVHAPDEPADVVRELGVLLSREDRRRLLQAFERRTPFELIPFWHALPTTDFDLDACLARFRNALVGVPECDARTIVAGACSHAEQRRCTESGPVVDALRQLSLPVPEWDEILLLVSITNCNIDDIQSFFAMPAEIPAYG